MKRRLLYTLAILFVSLQTFAQSTTKYEYDSNNRLIQVTYSNGVTVSYTYDELGNRLSKKVTAGVDFIRGDANGDGTVDESDVVVIVNYIMKKPLETFNFNAADVNGDGVVDIADVVGIVNIIFDNTPAARQMIQEIEAVMGN